MRCGIICMKETVMDQKIIIEKINTVLTKVHLHFDNADNQTIPAQYQKDKKEARQWWLNEYRRKTGNKDINMFSFNADDILKNNIPSWVVGCSGRADLFAKYASEMGLDVNIVAMVDTASKKKHPDGHQIIAVKFPDGSQQLIDPGRGRETYEKATIRGKCKVGEHITYNRRDGRTDYKIAAILSPDEHAKIDSIEKLSNLYKSQKQLSSWESGIKLIQQKINSINLRDMFAFSKNQETHE